MHIAAARIIAADAYVVAVCIRQPAGEEAAHELLAASGSVPVFEDQFRIGHAVTYCAAAVTCHTADPCHDPAADQGNTGFHRAAADRTVVDISCESSGEAVGRGLDRHMLASQGQVFNLCVFQCGEKPGEDRVIGLEVAVARGADFLSAGGNCEVVKRVAVAVETPAEGERLPDQTAHVDVRVQTVASGRIVPQSQHPLHIGDGGDCRGGESSGAVREEQEQNQEDRKGSFHRSDLGGKQFSLSYHNCRQMARIRKEKEPSFRQLFFDLRQIRDQQ